MPPPYASAHDVVAVVVTYQPDIALLTRLIVALSPQVKALLIVDNGTGVSLDVLQIPSNGAKLSLIRLERNLGVATAQNVGIRWSRGQQVNFVILMDQDSVPADDMVERLYSAIITRPDAAAMGPRYIDNRQGNPPPFIRIRRFKLERCGCDNEYSIVPVDYLISSGCMVPIAVLDKVGGLRDNLFVDYVDIEWGLRASYYGFQCYGVCSAHMAHSLGDQPIGFLGKKFPARGALRHYYMFRNALLLYRESWIPINWKLVDGWRLLLKYVFYSLFAKPRSSQFLMMTLGIWHGLIGKSGEFKYDTKSSR